MNYYCILSSVAEGYEQVDESTFISMVAEKQCKKYASKIYLGVIELDSVPEELRESVQKLVDEKVEKYGKYEDSLTTPFEAKSAIENLSGVRLTRGEAKALFSGIEKLRDGATDTVALSAVSAYPRLKGDGSLVKAGTRINWNGNLYRASVDLWDTTENNPENAYNLWEWINESHSGTIDDAIPYDGNMVLEKGKHYNQNDTTYLCTRDTVNPVTHALSDLVGLYVEEA